MKARKAYEYFETPSLLPSSGVDLEMRGNKKIITQ